MVINFSNSLKRLSVIRGIIIKLVKEEKVKEVSLTPLHNLVSNGVRLIYLYHPINRSAASYLSSLLAPPPESFSGSPRHFRFVLQSHITKWVREREIEIETHIERRFDRGEKEKGKREWDEGDREREGGVGWGGGGELKRNGRETLLQLSEWGEYTRLRELGKCGLSRFWATERVPVCAMQHFRLYRVSVPRA